MPTEMPRVPNGAAPFGMQTHQSGLGTRWQSAQDRAHQSFKGSELRPRTPEGAELNAAAPLGTKERVPLSLRALRPPM